MNDATPKRENEIERMFERPLTQPETSDGIGPTLGGDLTPEHERAEDDLYRREHEGRSFAPDEAVLRGARSA